MKQQKVVMRVSSITVKTAYSQTSMTVEAVGDVLYALVVPENGYTQDGETRIFNIEGIRHIIRGLQIALVFDTDVEDF